MKGEVTGKKSCPRCRASVYSLITDLANNLRYCWHCAPDLDEPVVKVTKKMDVLGLEAYSLDERMQDLRGDKPI